MDITPDKYVVAAAGYQHIRMYDLASNNPNPVINYEGVLKNITGLGFQVNINISNILFNININDIIYRTYPRKTLPIKAKSMISSAQ